MTLTEGRNLEILIVPDPAALAEAAAGVIRQQLLEKPASVLGLATGSTPEATYARLIRYHKEEGLDFSKVASFNLDEYLGLPRDHEQSYWTFMKSRLFDHVNIDQEKTKLPDGMAHDPERFCGQYEDAIRQAGGIDLQLLGIGSDGHIAFNEPGSSLTSRTRVKTLTKQTIEDNARLFFENNMEEVPQFAITMGVGTIMEAKHLLLLAQGERKAAICRAFIEGPVTSAVTASALQMHPRATVILDEAAASQLEHRDYYRWVQERKDDYAALKARLRGV